MRTYSIGFLVLVAGVAVAVSGPAAAQSDACGAVLADERNGTTGPGGELADAIGDQRSEIGSELNDRWFDASLDNASSDAERARIVAAEVERIDQRYQAIDSCWSAHQRAADSDRQADQLPASEVDLLRRQALTLHRRVNETEVEAAKLPAPLRQRHDIDERSVAELERRIERLRDAMGPIERDAERPPAAAGRQRPGERADRPQGSATAISSPFTRTVTAGRETVTDSRSPVNQ